MLAGRGGTGTVVASPDSSTQSHSSVLRARLWHKGSSQWPCWAVSSSPKGEDRMGRRGSEGLGWAAGWGAHPGLALSAGRSTRARRGPQRAKSWHGSGGLAGENRVRNQNYSGSLLVAVYLKLCFRMKSARDSGRGLCWFQAKGTHACVEWVGMHWVGAQGTLPGTGGRGLESGRRWHRGAGRDYVGKRHTVAPARARLIEHHHRLLETSQPGRE